jgi:ketosteroid isomerase-like protein
MSEENVEIVRRGFEHFQATGEFRPEFADPEFVWDMSTFRGWPEEKTYAGIEGAQRFIRDWLEARDDWQLDVQSFHDAGDKVVAILRQHGRAKTTGMPIDMTFAQVHTVRHGKQVRIEMYADPAKALEAAGLRE